MEEPIQRCVDEMEECADKCMEALRLLPQTKENQAATHELLRIYKRLTEKARDLRLREL